VHQTLIRGTHTPNNGSRWRAECWISNKCYEAMSRHGAVFALARMLKQAGVADQDVTVTGDDFPGVISYPSLDRLAGRTITEGAATLLREVRFDPLDISTLLGAGEAKMGVSCDPVANRPSAEKAPIFENRSLSPISQRKHVPSR